MRAVEIRVIWVILKKDREKVAFNQLSGILPAYSNVGMRLDGGQPTDARRQAYGGQPHPY
jgi:hypothetical protein